MFCFDANGVEAFGAREVNVVQIERWRIRIGDSETNKMDGLIPVTQPIREDKPRSRFEAMGVDMMGRRRERRATATGSASALPYTPAEEGVPATTAPRRAISSGAARARPPGCPGLPPSSRTKGAPRMRLGGGISRRPSRSGVGAVTRRSGGNCRRRRRGTGANHGGRSRGGIEDPGGNRGEGPPKP